MTGDMQRSASADRMRLSRQRKRDGMVVVSLVLEPSYIAKLLRYRLLTEDQRGDPDALTEAVYGLLDRVA